MGWFKRLFGGGTAPEPDGVRLPYEMATTPGEGAEAERARIEAEGAGRFRALLLGDPDEAAALAEAYQESDQSPEEILFAARNWTPQAVLAALQQALDEEEAEPPDVGEWDEEGAQAMAPTASMDLETLEPLPEVVIARIPCEHSWMTPAYLRFGDFNECPAPDQHVVLLRDWNARYGAEVTAITVISLECSVAQRPAGRDEAMALAREFAAYCPDLVEQGYGTLSDLAAALLISDTWHFWWD